MSPKRRVLVEDYWRIRQIEDVQTSTNGQTAFVVSSVCERRNQRRSAIWLTFGELGGEQLLSDGRSFDEQPRWSPDGTQLAFLRTAYAEGEHELCVFDVRSNEARTLHASAYSIGAVAWAPHSNELCFAGEVPVDDLWVAAENDWRVDHANAAACEPLRRFTSLRGRVNGVGFRERRSQLFGVSLSANAVPARLTDDQDDDIDPAWSPDGRFIAFVSNRSADMRILAERNVWTLDVESGERRQLTDGYWLDGPLAWSPDGKQIACVGARGLRVPFSLRLWLVDVAGGATPASEGFGAHLWPITPVWVSDDRVVVAAGFAESGALLAYDRQTGRSRVLQCADAVLGRLALMPDRTRFLAVATSTNSPSRLIGGTLESDAFETLVDVNSDWLTEVEVAGTRPVSVKSEDGLTIEGWLVIPPDALPPYACVLDVHYGPNAAWGPAFAFGAQAAASRGFATLFLNPRGSTGYGDAFAAAADYGGKDYADLVLGLDTLVAQNVIDSNRLGIMGLSYGGFMANWAIAQTSRFKAAVSINGISNQLTWYLLSDTGLFFYRDRFGEPLQSASGLDLFWRHSPLALVANVETPLLLLHSENDYRCPIDQAEQIFGALVAQNRTVELIRFPQGAHDLLGTAPPLHSYLAQRLTIEWFERFITIEQ